MYKNEGGEGKINVGASSVEGQTDSTGTPTTAATGGYNENLEQFYTKLNTSSSTIKMTAADWKTIDDIYAGK